MRKILFSVLGLLCLSGQGIAGAKKKVLFVGNSYTFTNNMPDLFDSIAKAMGDTSIHDMSAPGGYTLNQHTTNPVTISKIAAQPWDVVVIHEQSQMPAFPPAQVATDTYPYATRLDSMVRANDSCTQTMFMMTWGHANGDPGNCPFYPVICTYTGQQLRLRESYLQMGQDNHACVAPVGMAFKLMMDSTYAPWLFSADSSHPVLAGSYLEAGVLYASIFHKPFTGCSYTAGLPLADAQLLQRIATKIVFDSLGQWQGYGHYPYAGFTTTGSGSTRHYTHQSPVTTQHYWSFGDGGTDTASNPHHTYTTAGTYVVTHTVSNGCFTETSIDSVTIAVSNVYNITGGKVELKFANRGSGAFQFALESGNNFNAGIFDLKGCNIKNYYNVSEVSDELMPGIYLLRLEDHINNIAVTYRLAVN